MPTKRRSQALKLYKALRERLYRELGVEPEPATKALRDRIRQRRTTRRRGCGSGAGGDGPSPGRRSPAAAKPSIAVLPFTNMSGDPDQEYFADGLTEDIITDLSQVSALSVVARHTAFAFKGKTLQVQQVARDLKVDYVLEGSVRKSDGQVRVTAQLIDGATGDHRWAHRYDRRFDDIFALQDEISKSIVDVLRVTLLPAELETITRHPTADARAYEYYLMGRFFYLRGQGKRHLAIARDMYAKAAEIDPDYARAYAGMAICDSYAAASDPGRLLRDGAREQRAGARLGCQPGGGLCRQGVRAVRSRALRRGGGRVRAGARGWIPACSRRISSTLAIVATRACARRRRRCSRGRRSCGPSDFRSPGLLAWECKALGRREQFAAALRRCLARLEAEVKAHPDNADALVFGSSILVESGDSARAEDWRPGPSFWARMTASFSTTRRSPTRCSAGSDAALDHLEQAFSAPPTFRRRLAAWMKYDGEMDGSLRDHPRFQALLADLDAGGAIAAERPAPARAEPAAERERRRQRSPRSPCCPFINLSGDPEQQYFSDGITEDIITELSRFRTLFVIARNSSFQYRGGNLDVTRIGRELGVRYLVEGSVRRIGDRVRITAQLDRGRRAAIICGPTTTTAMPLDILTLQDDIVRAIATTLGDRIDAAGRERALRLSPEALSAYDHVLRSEAHFLRFTQGRRTPRRGGWRRRRSSSTRRALTPRSSWAGPIAWTTSSAGSRSARRRSARPSPWRSARSCSTKPPAGRARCWASFTSSAASMTRRALSFARPSPSTPTMSRRAASTAST